jgi:hypothetical protein
MTPAQQRRRFQSDASNGAIAMSARTPAPQLQQWQLRQGNTRDDASVTTLTMAQQPHHNNRRWRQRQDGDNVHRDNREDANTTTATMPKQRWQWCQSNDDASAAMTTIPK